MRLDFFKKGKIIKYSIIVILAIVILSVKHIDEYIFNVSVNNSSISKKMLKGSNTPINKLVRYFPETDTIEELS